MLQRRADAQWQVQLWQDTNANSPGCEALTSRTREVLFSFQRAYAPPARIAQSQPYPQVAVFLILGFQFSNLNLIQALPHGNAPERLRSRN